MAGTGQGTLSVHGLVLAGHGRGLGRRQDALRRQLLELGGGLLVPAPARDLPAEQGMREQAFGELRRWRHRYPAAFVNGHMFAGVFQVSLFVRLAEKESIVESEAKLTAWLSRALRYVASLPPTSRK